LQVTDSAGKPDGSALLGWCLRLIDLIDFIDIVKYAIYGIAAFAL